VVGTWSARDRRGGWGAGLCERDGSAAETVGDLGPEGGSVPGGGVRLRGQVERGAGFGAIPVCRQFDQDGDAHGGALRFRAIRNCTRPTSMAERADSPSSLTCSARTRVDNMLRPEAPAD